MSGPSAASARRSRRAWVWFRRAGLLAVTVGVVEYFALPQIVAARSDLHLFVDASPTLLALALLFETASLLSYTSLTRVVLPVRARPRFIDQLRIDLTGLGVSHVVPGGGATASALRFRLMTQWGVPPDDAASTAAVETAVTAIGLVATFAGGVVLIGPGLASQPGYAAAGLLAMAVLIAVGVGLHRLGVTARVPSRASVRPSRQQADSGRGFAGTAVRRAGRTATETVRATARRTTLLVRDPQMRVTVFVWAACNWIFDAASLWVCLKAYGVSLGPGALLTAYGAANLVGLLPVTPGGLGIVEGVLIPALSALGGAAVAPVTLGVLTWRLFEFWIPIPISGLTYLSLRIRPRHPRHDHHRPHHERENQQEDLHQHDHRHQTRTSGDPSGDAHRQPHTHATIGPNQRLSIRGRWLDGLPNGIHKWIGTGHAHV